MSFRCLLTLILSQRPIDLYCDISQLTVLSFRLLCVCVYTLTYAINGFVFIHIGWSPDYILHFVFVIVSRINVMNFLSEVNCGLCVF